MAPARDALSHKIQRSWFFEDLSISKKLLCPRRSWYLRQNKYLVEISALSMWAILKAAYTDPLLKATSRFNVGICKFDVIQLEDASTRLRQNFSSCSRRKTRACDLDLFNQVQV